MAREFQNGIISQAKGISLGIVSFAYAGPIINPYTSWIQCLAANGDLVYNVPDGTAVAHYLRVGNIDNACFGHSSWGGTSAEDFGIGWWGTGGNGTSQGIRSGIRSYGKYYISHNANIGHLFGVAGTDVVYIDLTSLSVTASGVNDAAIYLVNGNYYSFLDFKRSTTLDFRIFSGPSAAYYQTDTHTFRNLAGTAHTIFNSVGLVEAGRLSIGGSLGSSPDPGFGGIYVGGLSQFAGGIKYAVVNKTANYTMTSSDYICVVNSSTPVTITLPYSGGNGQAAIVKNKGVGQVTVTRQGSTDLIDGQVSWILSQYNSVTVVDTATNVWSII